MTIFVFVTHSIFITSVPNYFRLLKLEILASLANESNAEKLLTEMQTCLRHHNTSFVCATIRAVGRVAGAAPSCAGRHRQDRTGQKHIIMA